jgi:hypothetical protein
MRGVTVIVCAWVVCSSVASAQTAPAPAAKFGITDNAFLVEEAFNQDPGIFQNIFVAARSRSGQWGASFTQEWPVRSQRHQLSFTLPFSAGAGSRAMGDVYVNYRLQVTTEEAGRAAFSPRLSAIVPSSAGSDRFGWQINLPVSKQIGAVYLHGNAGNTWEREPAAAPPGSARAWASTPFVAASAIVAIRPMFHVMFEAFVEAAPVPGGRDTSTTVVPGVRTGWNFGDRQFVIGVGAPITRGATRDHGVLTYFSYELPFARR